MRASPSTIALAYSAHQPSLQELSRRRGALPSLKPFRDGLSISPQLPKRPPPSAPPSTMHQANRAMPVVRASS